ncbi:MAG: hypothetical protein M0Q51_08945 [Bacteroidales bacterium]|nr:hypothetical protein [Bacteroidales bacterium]
MKRLIYTNPFIILLLEIGVIAVSLILFYGCKLVLPIENIKYCLIIVIALFLAGYFFWIYLIALGFHILSAKNDKDYRFKNFIIVLIILYIIAILSYSSSIYFISKSMDQILGLISILTGLISFFCLMYIIVYLTNNFKFFDKKNEPRFWDYFISMFLISFFPFGLMIMHDHLRLIMKENLK